jgi:hypothetical protein
MEGKVARFPLRKLIASAVIWLLGGVLLSPTRATAEEDVNTALRVYDSGNSTDRKTEEIVFLNAQAGLWWANSVLFYRKQQPLFCPPDNAAPVPGAQVLEMVRRQVDEKPCGRGNAVRTGHFDNTSKDFSMQRLKLFKPRPSNPLSPPKTRLRIPMK